MTLDGLRPLADRMTAPFVTGAKRAGFTPDAVSVLALLAAIGAAVSFYVASETQLAYLLGAVLVACNGLLDLIDGALARELDTTSPGGDLLDHVLDRYADIALVAGLAAGIGEFALGFAAVTGVVMTSYLGTQAEAVGLDRVYGGLLGRADRLVLVGLVATVAAFVEATVQGLTVVGWLLVVFAVVGHLTALQRFYYARRDLR
jgi:archaetidylinositol phosphate synthase